MRANIWHWFWAALAVVASFPCTPARAREVPAMLFARQPMTQPGELAGQPNITMLSFFTDPRPAPSFGFSDQRFWARLAGTLAAPGATSIRVDAPSSDLIAAYARCGAGGWGRLARITARYATFALPVPHAGCDILLREETRSTVRFNVTLLAQADFAAGGGELLIGMALGVSLAISAMVGFLFAATRQPELLHFLFYQAASALLVLRIWGFVPGLFGSQPAWLGGLMGVAGLNLWVSEFLAYARTSLHLRATYPRLDRAFAMASLLSLADIAGEALHMRFQWIGTVCAFAGGLACWSATIAVSWRGNRARALQQLLGFMPTIVCFALFIASLRGSTTLNDVRPLFLAGQIGTTLALGFWMAQGFKQDRDRREIMLRDTVHALQDNRAELEIYQTDLEDMVSARTAELQRAVLNERAIVAQQRDFTAMIGHEFRTPLAVIDGQARRLARSLTAHEEMLRRSCEIRDAVRDMIALMDGLLFHARSDNGVAEYRFETVQLAFLITRAVENAIPTARRDNLVLAPVPELQCRADPALLATALGNLLSNAAKYSPEGAPIEVTSWLEGGVIVIEVKDHGGGVPASEQEAIFARFQRGSNATSSIGSGLGLFMARQIAEGHGGRITLQASSGQGSIFTLAVPGMKAALAEPLAPQEAA